MRVASFFESLIKAVSVAVIVALVAAVALWYALERGTTKTITAYFPTSTGLYEKNSVTMLGLPVGTIDEIVPMGNVVRVVMRVSNDVAVPADARAAIVTPTLVSDRYIQLAPTYTGGPKMGDGAIIPIQRTAVPIELDSVYKSLDTLASALGPNGANKNGSLNDLLRSSARALNGNGPAFKNTLDQVSAAVSTINDNRANLFGTVDNLDQFTGMLAANDGNVRQLNDQLQDVSGFLAAERGNLSQVLQILPPTLANVARFIRDNKDSLHVDVNQLANVTDVLVRQQAGLTELLNVAPTALDNLTNVYNASSGTLDTRPLLVPNLGLNLDPRALLCGLFAPVNGSPNPLATAPGAALLTTACTALLDPTSLARALAPFTALAQQLKLPIPPLTGVTALQNLPANIANPGGNLTTLLKPRGATR